jgi:hypothetical protein
MPPVLPHAVLLGPVARIDQATTRRLKSLEFYKF